MEMFLLLLLLSVPLLLLVLLGWLSVEFCPMWMCLQLNLLCRLFRAHVGKLQAYNAFLKYSISSLSACCFVEPTLVLCAKVLKTVCFAVGMWLLSQCRYWSACLGFLQRWWGCCWDLEKPRCPGMVELPLGPVPLWCIVCVGLCVDML